jgi:SAM-dependent methyltransferase
VGYAPDVTDDTGAQRDARPEAQFDRVARRYADSPTHASGPDLDWLVGVVRGADVDTVVDLGTGPGHVALALVPFVPRLFAIDVSSAMLEVAQALGDERGATGIEWLHADVADLPLEDRSVGAVVSRYSAHHWASPSAAAREVRRVLRPGGPFALVDTVADPEPALDTFGNALEWLRDPSHGRNLRVDEWETILRAAGLEVVSVHQDRVDLDVEAWLERSETEPWRAEAVRRLLATAPPAARERFAIPRDATRWSERRAWILARHGDGARRSSSRPRVTAA